MVKGESLSSDVNFIKEFEELKLKQKLLIESLKKKSQSEQERLFLEINAKLDFLVKIFKEANSDEEKPSVDIESKFNEVFDKIDSLSKKIDESLEKVVSLETKSIATKKELDRQKSISSNPNNSLDSNSQSSSGVSAPPAPPIPNFKSDISNSKTENKVDEINKSTEDVVGKKKKWF